MRLTPKGIPARNTDPVMLLAVWTKQLRSERGGTPKRFITSGMGKPSFPMNAFATKAAALYWSELWSRSQEARHIVITQGAGTSVNRDKIAGSHAVIDYGDPQGEPEARRKMAEALNHWYGFQANIREEHILFTVGGAGALYDIFEVINHQKPNGRIVTPFPHYSLYTGSRKKNRLFPIDVMQEPGYRLTAKALEKALCEASAQGEIDGGKVSAFLFCDPNNPLGTFIDEEELKKIAKVLEAYPDVYVIIDGAYEEMRLDGRKHVPLLSVASPELRQRIILMRSATKALSAAGERMAVLVAFDDALMAELIQQNIDISGHAPKSLQYAFAEAMHKIDDTELNNLVGYYKPQVDYVMQRVRDMGATLPDPTYHTAATFYVLADLSDLIGMPMPEGVERAIQTIDFSGSSPKPQKKLIVENDEDVVYSLLFSDHVMVCPCSYFGIDGQKGYVRITCSGGDGEMQELLNRLEYRLYEARMEKQKNILGKLQTIQNKLLEEHSESEYVTAVRSEIDNILRAQQNGTGLITANRLKEANLKLTEVLQKSTVYYRKQAVSEQARAALSIQSFFRGYKGRKIAKEHATKTYQEWITVVKDEISAEQVRHQFFQFGPTARLDFKPWLEHLRDPNPAPAIVSKL